MTRLSIVLSTKNHSQWLSQCLECVCHQSFSDFEFLICNDGSSDNTQTILNKWEAKDPRIFLQHRRTSIGMMRSYDKLLQKAKGEFIWMIASDDYAHDLSFLERGFKGLANYPHLSGFFSNCRRIIASSGEWDGNWGWWGWPRPIFSKNAFNEFLKGRLEICGAGLVLRRSTFLKMGGYDANVGSLCDMLLATEIAIHHGLWFIGRCSITMRVFPKGQSHGTKAGHQKTLRNWIEFEKHLEKKLLFRYDYNRWMPWRCSRIATCVKASTQGNLFNKRQCLFWINFYKRNLPSHLQKYFDTRFYLNHIYYQYRPSWIHKLLSRFKRSAQKRMDMLSRYFMS